MIPIINGQQYSWASITINIYGKPLTTIRAINYTDAEEMENVYGAGKLPIGQSFGNITFEGSITLLLSEAQTLADLSPSKRIQDLPAFEATVTYLAAGRQVKHVLRSCKFMSMGVDAAQGDMNIEIEIPLLIGFIQWGDVAIQV